MNKKDETKSTKLNPQTRKEIGLELRKTHFHLGNENMSFNTQYRKDYVESSTKIPKPFHDNVALRKTHFALGIYLLTYILYKVIICCSIIRHRKIRIS